MTAAQLAPWRRAVRRATAAVGLIELPSSRYVELSPLARQLVGPGSTSGSDVLAPDEQPATVAIMHAASSGAVDGTETRRRTWHRSDGSTVDVTVRGRVIRTDGESHGIFVARDLAHPSADPLAGFSADALGWATTGLTGPSVTATLDPDWRVGELIGDTGPFGDVLDEGVDLGAVTHRDDLVRLLFAFAGATTHVDSSTRLRLLSGGGPIAVEVEVTRDADGDWCVTLAPVHRPVHELAGALRRIASELQHVGAAVDARSSDVLEVPAVRNLPERQQEIVIRLARGERVGTIASKLFISTNTVRNHLTAVYRKFGVHSQEELLALLRGDPSDESPSPT
ncbi:MAG: Response regulator containing a CheY-like receiver domain and an DNA-binding domain [Actinomycetia bacterium]|nr:Response regulator containing a CheY-like receiver domain and an DNA-binding domain [Actinomycetes bacterium]